MKGDDIVLNHSSIGDLNERDEVLIVWLNGNKEFVLSLIPPGESKYVLKAVVVCRYTKHKVTVVICKYDSSIVVLIFFHFFSSRFGKSFA